ncbi:FGGY-family carbohydrate kinase [Spirosoma montaniterrae]|uniref:Carbohydrate kinase n=1 Tax=Spirosoma montaniterrae TaxID=1178516 RepID=A0A1P9WTU9_9BACT|nr:FGGY family carbohydrate kinase [Spirosoma montaniterrae]AQG78811.1 carbohydrate kinase [Spirosoma montaniterrae]
MPTPVIAIFDIGKTNKKLFLFDQHYRIVWERSVQLPETVDEDGDPCEDIQGLTNWVLETTEIALALPQFTVLALNFTTYGASFVYVDARGQQVGPLYNYLKPFPDAIRERFLQQYGPANALSLQTASPWLDSLNSGLMLYRIKYDKPELFQRIRYALHLPQYVSYLITGQIASDLTSIGCHTMLWDFGAGRYHDWVVSEGLDRLLGPLFPADEGMDATQPKPEDAEPNTARSLRVGVGLHDSSAALIPYLASFHEPFILISTGTWCISMNPFIETEGTGPALTADELQHDCLCYMHYRGKSVKASRLFSGYEHEQQTKRLAAHFGVDVDHYKQVRYNASIINQLQEAAQPVHSESGSITGPAKMMSLKESPFGQRDLSRFANYETAYHQLMLDLMAGQVLSTALVLPHNEVEQPAVTRIFVDGGFSQNPLYMNLLAKAFPQVEVWAASVAQATALGAALAFHDQWNPQPVPPNLITLTHYQRLHR